MRRTTMWLASLAACIALSAAPLAAAQAAATKKPAASKSAATAKKAKNAKKTKKAKKAPAPVINPMTKTAAKTKTAPAVVTGSSGTIPAPWTPDNPIAKQLSGRTTELTRVRRVLPPGSDLNAATVGFKNYGQFTAAINATEHKQLDFWKLKSLMTGINMDGTRTNRPLMSLGQATQALHGTATTPPGGNF